MIGIGSTRPLKVVFLGDSLTQGTQDGQTWGDRQVHGYAQQVSQALGVAPDAAYLTAPGVPFDVFHNGEFNASTLHRKIDKLKLAVAPLALETMTKAIPDLVPPLWRLTEEGHRTKASQDTPQHPQNNFAVPGFKARHLLSIRNDRDMLDEVRSGLMGSDAVATEVPLTQAVLQNGGRHTKGSEIDQAIQARPDIAVVWAGANDTLHALEDGYLDDAELTPLHDQHYTYRVTNPVNHKVSTRTSAQVLPGYESLWLGADGIMDRLLHQTDADIFLMTLPQAAVTPSLRPLGQKMGPLPFKVRLKDGSDVTSEVENWVVPSGVQGAGHDGRTAFPHGSKVFLLTALNSLLENGKIQTRAQFDARLQGLPSALFTEDQVADPDEQATVEERTRQFNDVLARAARLSPRVHLVDDEKVLEDIQAHGHPLTGKGPPTTVTTTFTGTQRDGMDGLFSYDGLHPSDTGHAIIANMLLDHMKADLAGNPRFAAVQNAQRIDEKAVFAQDPHHLLSPN